MPSPSGDAASLNQRNAQYRFDLTTSTESAGVRLGNFRLAGTTGQSEAKKSNPPPAAESDNKPQD